MRAKKLISIVIPIHNEEKNIPLVHAALVRVFKEELNSRYHYEIIFVNDGSSDGSWQAIQKLGKRDEAIKGLCFSRNFGHQYALEAGIEHACGDALITMDGDLEHPPEVIPELISEWEHGFEVVNTLRKNNGETGRFKRWSSTVFYKLVNLISDIRLTDGCADFRLIDRQVVDVIKGIHESERFYRGLIQWVGFQSTLVEYRAGKRQHGETSFGLWKMIIFAWSGVISSTMLPMQAIVFIGSVITVSSALLLTAMFYVRWFVSVEYFSQLAFLVVFIILSNGIILLAVGIIAMYLIRIYKETGQRPNYIVRQVMNVS